MKHQAKKKLALKPETIRQLDHHELPAVNGGIFTFLCPPTAYYTCHPKTPGCTQ